MNIDERASESPPWFDVRCGMFVRASPNWRKKVSSNEEGGYISAMEVAAQRHRRSLICAPLLTTASSLRSAHHHRRSLRCAPLLTTASSLRSARRRRQLASLRCAPLLTTASSLRSAHHHRRSLRCAPLLTTASSLAPLAAAFLLSPNRGVTDRQTHTRTSAAIGRLTANRLKYAL